MLVVWLDPSINETLAIVVWTGEQASHGTGFTIGAYPSNVAENAPMSLPSLQDGGLYIN